MKRKHIPMKVKLAAALLQARSPDGYSLISYERAKKMTANQIIGLFHWDHYPIPHADGGPDEPWNLWPMLVAEHREKTRKVDVPTIAKGKRIRRKQTKHELRLLSPLTALAEERPEFMQRTISIDEARALYPDILLPHPDTTAPMPREVYSGRSTKPFRIVGRIESRGFDKTKTRGFNGKVRPRKKK